MMTAAQAIYEMRNQRQEDTAQPKHTSAPTLLGNPDCVHCHGLGLVRFDLPTNHKFFGRIFTCECVQKEMPPL